MPSQVLVLRIFKELSFAPVEDTLEGLCMLSRALVSHWGEKNRFDFVGRRLKVRRKVCVGWGLDFKGLGLSFNAPYLLCVIWVNNLISLSISFLLSLKMLNSRMYHVGR